MRFERFWVWENYYCKAKSHFPIVKIAPSAILKKLIFFHNTIFFQNLNWLFGYFTLKYFFWPKKIKMIKIRFFSPVFWKNPRRLLQIKKSKIFKMCIFWIFFATICGSRLKTKIIAFFVLLSSVCSVHHMCLTFNKKCSGNWRRFWNEHPFFPLYINHLFCCLWSASHRFGLKIAFNLIFF